MPDVDLGHQFELGEELFDLVAGTFPEEPTAFSEDASVSSKELDPRSLPYGLGSP